MPDATATPAVDPKAITKTETPVEAKPGEQPKAEPKTDDKPKDSAAQRFAQLAKKEKGLLLKQQDLKAREEAIAKRIADMEAKEQEREKRRAVYKQNPLAALEDNGLDYDSLTAYVLNDKKPTPDLAVKSVKEELEAFKRQQEDERKKAIEEEKARIAAEEKAAVERFHRENIDFVKANAAQYEYITALDQHHVVNQVIEQHFAQSKKVLTAKEAADLVEQFLEEHVVKATATKKWQAKQQQAQQKAEPEKRPDPAPQRSINNGMTASMQSFAAAHNETDRMKRAVAAWDSAKKP